MEHKKFRLRLNLFDTIILILALIVGGALVVISQRDSLSTSTAVTTTYATATYTIRLQYCAPEIEGAIQPGDQLEDAVKNLDLGTVVSVTYSPTPTYVLNEETLVYEYQENPLYLNADIVVTSPVTLTEDEILLTSSYRIRGGETVYVRGPGYLGSGMILDIEREGLV